MMDDLIPLAISAIITLILGLVCIIFPRKIQKYVLNNTDTFAIVKKYYESNMFVPITRISGVGIIGMFLTVLYLIFFVVL